MLLPTAVTDDPSSAFLVSDASSRVVWVSATLGEFLGVRREELLGEQRERLVGELFRAVFADADRVAERFSIRSSGGCGFLDCRILPAEGRRERWVAWRGLPITSGPYAGGLIDQFVDVTAGRRLRGLMEASECADGEASASLASAVAQQAAQDRFEASGRAENALFRAPNGGEEGDESHCRALLEQADVGMVVIDSGRTILLSNGTASRLAGYGGRNLAGEKCFHVFAGGEGLCPFCPECFLLPGKAPLLREIEKSVDGSPRILQLKAFPLTSQGRTGLLLEDITDRKQGENGLREAFAEAGRAREWIDSILRSVPDGLVVTDRDDRMLLMNRAAEKLLGITQPPLFQPRLQDCLSDRRLLKRLREAIQSEEDGGRFDYEIGGDPAGVRVVTVSVSLLRDRGGNAQGSVFLLRDTTRERELDRMKNEFISTAAHELRTPLTAIMGFSELLLTRQDLPAEQRADFLTFIHQKAENLARIISDLLDVSRIEAGRGLELFRQPCDINALIAETLAPYRTCSALHELQIALPQERVCLHVDRGKIIQVLENLLSNAFKYSPRGGRVRLSATLARGAYLVSVEDQGIGMTREQVRRAFDKFYRGDASNGAVEGTGLGLSITKYIVEAHGGRIWLESAKGKGTTAFFTLPMTGCSPQEC